MSFSFSRLSFCTDLHAQSRIAGLLCLGYPFHPIGKPEKLRVHHLEALQTPTLICQGSRDPFGTRAEVKGKTLKQFAKRYIAANFPDLARGRRSRPEAPYQGHRKIPC